MNIFEWIFLILKERIFWMKILDLVLNQLNWVSITNIQTLLALQQYVYNCKPRIADFINSHLCLQRCLAFAPSASLWDSSWKDKVSKLHSRSLKPNISTCERDLFEDTICKPFIYVWYLIVVFYCNKRLEISTFVYFVSTFAFLAVSSTQFM